ncbi:glycosyltransferase family 1 protein [Anaerolineae bacterium CFX8]|nr:glycosyltransferase family 1 protein [Anaerolineae bacterium CFX8]
MAYNRLFEALTQFDTTEIERIFGNEYAFDTSESFSGLAPVKRVVIVAEAFLPKVDGVSKSAYLTMRHLQRTGREVLVLAPDIAPTSIGPTRVVPLPSFGVPLAPETRIALPTPVIGDYLDEFKPDLIHLFSPALLSVSAMLAGRRRSLPIVANYQTDLPAYAHHYGLHFLSQPTRDWLRYIHNGCHLTLVPSNYTLRQLQSWGYHRLRRWGRGVNGQRFNPAHRTQAWREKLLNGRDPDSLLCIYVGRLAVEKRVDLLVEVARLPGVALTIIGDGAMRGELEELFAGTNTHFMGYLFGDDLSRAFASADVFMFTGPAETFGQVVQEAMASGLPGVVINQGGVADLVVDGETGYLCEDDPASFAAAARRLRDDLDLRRRLSENARRAAERQPWSAIMAQLEAYYTEAIQVNNRMKRMFPPNGLNIPLPVLFRPR